MKKNLPLYILLVFLIIVNCFFLYNYLAADKNIQSPKERKPPGSFLIKELGFDEQQKEQFRALSRTHHHEVRGISDEIRELKDIFFSGLSDASITINIDSLATLIGDLETKKDLQVYHHFEKVQGLCNPEQRDKFNRIIQDALKRVGREQRPPRGRRPEGNRPLKPGKREGKL